MGKMKKVFGIMRGMKNVNPNVIAAAIVGVSVVIAAFVLRDCRRYDLRKLEGSVLFVFDTFTGSRFFHSGEGEWVELNPVKGYRRKFTIP